MFTLRPPTLNIYPLSLFSFWAWTILALFFSTRERVLRTEKRAGKLKTTVRSCTRTSCNTAIALSEAWNEKGFGTSETAPLGTYTGASNIISNQIDVSKTKPSWCRASLRRSLYCDARYSIFGNRFHLTSWKNVLYASSPFLLCTSVYAVSKNMIWTNESRVYRRLVEPK